MYQLSKQYKFLIALTLTLTFFVFWGGIENLLHRWLNEENYSHGILIPLISIYFIWQQRFKLTIQAFNPSWFSLIIVLIAFVFLLIGEITALYLVIHYALLAVLFSIIIATTGWNPLKYFLGPLFLLALSIPLPYFLEAGLSSNLQLISSQLGVQVIQMLNIPVFLEGNIIDLGSYKLQVVEACSGLRYLFPLMSFGFIAAYLYHVELWKRLLIFLSTIPITILMNSFRIAVVGILVNSWGIEMAEGFIHDFEGWILFVICAAILLLEMKLLTKVGQKSNSLFDVFMTEPNIESITKNAADKAVIKRTISKPLIVISFMLAVMFIIINLVDERDEQIPERKELILFPLTIGTWNGEHGRLTSETIKSLKLSDYLTANFQVTVDYQGQKKQDSVNLYVAYYESQRKGASPHSPKVCVPGGGWEITQISRKIITDYLEAGILHYNRVVIQKGEERQLIYYWFQQRGRLIANEYLMKWYLFLDAIQKNRTDGALVRLATPIKPTEKMSDADQRLKIFINDVGNLLPEYIPD